MTAISTNQNAVSIPGAEIPTPELTRAVGEQFGPVALHAMAALEQLSAGLRGRLVSGDTQTHLAGMRNALDMLAAHSDALAGRGQVHVNAANVVRSVTDVGLPEDSYYGSTNR